MAEPIYRACEILAQFLVRATGTRITYAGEENIPQRGGAVIAINHTSYVDFLPAGLAMRRRHRRLRFMIKAEMQRVKIVNFLIKRNGAIPVDRSSGHDAYDAAVQALQDGELVAVYPEATISRSFELKEFKTGAARMAVEAGVPIVPLIVWGAQRIWTKGLPRQLGRKKVPVTVAAGPPLPAARDITLTDKELYESTNEELYESMTSLLHRVQQDYPHPAGERWVPCRLGGGAPTVDEAARMDAEETAARAARRKPRQSR
ncbi:1-acyl-sn-glycerol-3-phosphate acyltransferase [Mycobacterium paragordonae]|jgi:1-acyl-sn-glycerol-3-phosphate acyltransferase|uniref:1-acyl-sn-glycerol-3-phosphate acyltransferase n=1 Tax=Mycobacterium paragordonae TaxID=1389713 RepID=A0A386UDI9_9MYCO|nr:MULTISPECIES: lysophospholipid acyltransferase family protein [Mycobacterium]PJE21323.1 MAG: 1-acyl-sn-glycerol-3-phosphate acyltransferase [Mycobacterium sp.]AYE98338.1 1-acyl-sn-glycerol-3-phosphate acyltransferase [Mycobacterium paragordonae]MDP7738055.1 lysophospholipid acyltransferase family protein [Mycobacterium paragordonae]OBJ76179.1 acyltransferase [Mycobacterium gordonae]TDK85880.1 1-acyl-sn-glycerol-3-phosphate acyltransferase [Mycobacterium paragordonae]